MNFIFRILLTFNATSLLVIVYLVQQEITLDLIDSSAYGIPSAYSNTISYISYLLLPVTLTWLSLLLCRLLGKDSFSEKSIVSIEHANNSFLPSYLGYFFVALSINNIETLIFVYGLLFVFTFQSQALYFNPIFLVFKYEFYNITTNSGASIFLISKKRYKLPREVVINEAWRINNYTFIAKE